MSTRSSAVTLRTLTLLALASSTSVPALAQGQGNILATSVLAVEAAATEAEAATEILVTARRREERLQDVPIAITALGGDDLRNAGVSQLSQLQFEAPSVNIGTPNPRQTSISIRGLGNNPAADGLASSVGVYIDGVYLDRLGMANFDLLDVDRIEVLRGPQGTLFGKNTTAGAISVNTKAPSFTPELSASVDLGNLNLRQFQLSASAPINDKLAFRVSGYSTDRQGYLKNVNIGGHELSLHRQGIRGQLLFKPNDDLSIRLIGEYGRQSDSSGAFVLYNKGPSTGPANFLPFDTWANRLVAGGKISSAPIYDPTGLVSDQNRHQHLEQWQYGLTSIIDLKLGDYTLTSVTGYRQWKFTPQNDFDWGPADVIVNNGVVDHVKSFSQEIRLASPTTGPVDYVVGAYYFHRALNNHAFTTYGPDYSTARGRFPGLDNGTTNTYGNPSVNAYALFGQGTWHITPQIDLTAGVRGTHEKAAQTIRRVAFTGGNGGAIAPTVLPYPPTGSADGGHLSISKFTPSALGTLSWKPSRDFLTYATISYSAKAGGFNSPSIPQDSAGNFLPIDSLKVKPESATNYEVGFKSSFLDRRVSLDANLFLTDVKDYQANTLIMTQSGFQGLITNVGNVRAKGFEVELTVHPVDGLKLSSAVGYNDTKYRRFSNAPSVQGSTAQTQDLSGKPVVQAPKWNLNLGADYSTAITDSVEGYAAADFNYKSGYYGYVDNSAYSWIDGYTVTNFRLGARINDGAYDISGWIRNAFDNRYFYMVIPANTGSGGYYSTPAEPRTYGVSLKVKI